MNSDVADDSGGDGNGNSNSFSIEQLELARRINDACDFYQMLNVCHDASEAEINRVYKKIALKLHPDKNHAPGATDAFKLLRQAVETLTDEEKREEYDFGLMGGGTPSSSSDSEDSSDRSSSDSEFRSCNSSDDEAQYFYGFIIQYFDDDDPCEE